jgi:hypothetical protein
VRFAKSCLWVEHILIDSRIVVKEGVTVAERRWHLVFETLEKPDKSFETKLPDTKLAIPLVTGANMNILKL